MVYESRLELARIMLADFDPLVTGIATQPFLLTGPDWDQTRRHIPDLLLVHADGGVTVVDVKARSRMTDHPVPEQFAWTQRICTGKGGRLSRRRELLANFVSWLDTAAGRSSTPSRSVPC